MYMAGLVVRRLPWTSEFPKIKGKWTTAPLPNGTAGLQDDDRR